VCVCVCVCVCFEFLPRNLPRKRELPETFWSKSPSQSGEDEAFILSSAVMKMHAMKLRKTLELLAWVWFHPQEFYSIFMGTLHNMFWMKISKRTPKKKKQNTWLTKGLLKWFWLNIFFLGLSRYNSTYIRLAKATCKV